VVGDCLKGGNGQATYLRLIGKAQLHCPGIGRNADDWAVVLASAL